MRTSAIPEMERSKLERETIILFNEAEPDAEVYTHNGKLQKRILELCESRPDEASVLRGGSADGMTFRVPKRWVKIMPPRVPSQAQMEVIERMNRIRHGGE